MKKKAFLLCLVAALCICTVAAFVGCSDSNNVNADELAYVTMSINPSVEVVVNGKNIVVAINGANDDGKVLLADEELVGKTLDEVTVRIADLLVELKYVTEENGSDKTLSVSVSCDNSKLLENIETSINKGMEELERVYNITVEKAQKIAHSTLVELAVKAHPELSKEEIDAMSDKELVKLLQVDVIERAEFALVAIEEEFYKFKEMEFKFRYYDELKGMIEGLDSIKVGLYNLTMGTLELAMETLQSAEAKFLELRAEADILIINGVSVDDMIIDAAVKAIDTAIDALKVIYNKLEEYRDDFGTAIDADALLHSVEQNINDTKNGILAKYEERFSGAIAKANKKLADKKAELKGQAA